MPEEWLDLEGADGQAAPWRRFAGRQFAINQFEIARQVLDGWVKAFEQRFRPRRNAGRAQNLKRLRAALHEHLVEEQEGQAAEMVAVAMADDHGVDA